jgi:hypothetical protein
MNEMNEEVRPAVRVDHIRKSIVNMREKGLITTADLAADLSSAQAEFIRNPCAKAWLLLEQEMHRYQAFHKD